MITDETRHARMCTNYQALTQDKNDRDSDDDGLIISEIIVLSQSITNIYI